MKRAIIASHITNLTDARYFASWGIEHMMFLLKEIDIEKIIGINEWIEGIKTMVCFSNNNLHLIDEVMLRIKPDSIGVDALAGWESIFPYVNDIEIFNFYEGKKGMPSKLEQSSLDNFDVTSLEFLDKDSVNRYSEIQSSKESIASYLNQSSPEIGIIVRGSEENQVGLKAFEELDFLLESILG